MAKTSSPPFIIKSGLTDVTQSQWKIAFVFQQVRKTNTQLFFTLTLLIKLTNGDGFSGGEKELLMNDELEAGGNIINSDKALLSAG